MIISKLIQNHWLSDLSMTWTPVADLLRHFAHVQKVLGEGNTPVVLGRGSFGTVFAGIRKAYKGHRNVWGDLEVAIKESKEPFNDFLKEVEAMSKVVHPACLKILACQAPDARVPWAIVTQRMKVNLRTVISCRDRDRLPDRWGPTTQSIVSLGIAAGLCYLHRSEPIIIHRDIKPANILLDEQFYPKIGDFGLAKLMPKDPNAHISGAGTLQFTAPEIFGGGKLDSKIDVYSYGMLIYEMLTCNLNPRPPGCVSDGDFKSAVLRGWRPEIPPDVTPWYRDLIERCWKANPHERPEFHEILHDPNNFILAGCDTVEFETYKTTILVGIQ